MENTLENKAKFFAQYFGQEVRIWKEIPDNKCNIGYASLSEYAVRYSHLELTPLHLISDEDAVDVAKILGVMVAKEVMYAKHGLSYLEEFRNNQEDIYCGVADFLRSKGYALPYNGLSVEEQVSRNWVVIKNT